MDNLCYSYVFINITTFRIKEKNYLIYPTSYIPTFLSPILFSGHPVLSGYQEWWWFLGPQSCFCVRWLGGNCEMKFGDRVCRQGWGEEEGLSGGPCQAKATQADLNRPHCRQRGDLISCTHRPTPTVLFHIHHTPTPLGGKTH